MATMDVPPSGSSIRGYGAFATDSTAAGQPGGSVGQLQRVDGYSAGPGGLQYTQPAGDYAKRSSAGALAGYGGNAAEIPASGTQRASLVVGRNSGAFLPGAPQM